MHTGPFAPWEHYPKYLRHHEVQTPLSVIIEFFGINILEGHAEKLKEWRDYVISETFYKNKKHGPSDLLFIYHTNLRLVEALYLLLLKHDSGEFYCATVTEDQLQNERLEWETFPENLPKHILLNPYNYLRKLFKKLPPEHYRGIMTEWLYFAFSSEPASETLTAKDVAHTYEAQLNLYAIAWLIYQRESGNKHLKNLVESAKPSNALPSVFYNLDSDSSNVQKALIDKIVRSVKETVPSAKGIFYLGALKNDAHAIFLFVITDDREKRQGYELTSIIAGICKPFANVTALFNNVGNMAGVISGVNYFYNNIMLRCRLIFKDDDLLLPVPGPLDVNAVLQRSERYWQHWYGQSIAFYNEANLYKANGNYNLAALSLHQAVHNVLLALLRAVPGYSLNVPSLPRMLRISEMFTADLVKAFALDTKAGSEDFNLLNNAYHDASLNNNPIVDGKIVTGLMSRVQKILELAQAVYDRHRSTLNDASKGSQ